MNCEHPQTVLRRIDCGAGGIQYRRYCLTCWCSIGGAIAHAKAREELGTEEAPMTDPDTINLARDAYRSTTDPDWWNT
jgi:hypothetical protein